jgi:hexosaminidase
VCLLQMPGHMTAWGTALPELGIVMDCGTAHHQSNFSQADVSKEATFTVIEKVLKEIVPLFPDRYWGFGGDETCDWLTVPHIASWAAKHSGQPGFEANMSSHGALYRYFGKRVQDMLPTSKLPVWWNDAVVQNVTTPAEALFWNWGAGCRVYDKATKTHINKCPVGDELTGMLRAGRQVVQSHGWYVGPSETTDIASDPLRATFAGQYCGGDADSNGGGSWVDFYNKDPEWNATSATTEELKNLLGGEISSWGECRSPENFDQLVYPKMSAVGERLWSSASSNRSIVAAYPRLLEHRCRMVRRGIQVGVLSPGSCYTYPYSVNALSANE